MSPQLQRVGAGWRVNKSSRQDKSGKSRDINVAIHETVLIDRSLHMYFNKSYLFLSETHNSSNISAVAHENIQNNTLRRKLWILYFTKVKQYPFT